MALTGCDSTMMLSCGVEILTGRFALSDGESCQVSSEGGKVRVRAAAPAVSGSKVSPVV